MSDMKSLSVRALIMELLKNEFSGLDFWKHKEAKCAIICSGLIEPTNESNRHKFVAQLKELKTNLLNDVGQDSLRFLDSEIERYEYIRTISLYEEADDNLDHRLIETYSSLGASHEGVVAIHHNLNYKQLSKLTNGVFKRTSMVKFYISNERSVFGKIVSEMFESHQQITVATLAVQSNSRGEILNKHIFLFGERITKNKWNIVKSISVNFFVYRFISEDGTEMMLISPERCTVGDYTVTGVLTTCTDNKILTNTSKLPTKLPYIFAQSVKSKIIKYKSHDELMSRAMVLGVHKPDFFDYPFSVKTRKRTYKLKQPTWFKWFIWSWLTHQEKGLMDTWPFHIFMVGPQHSGKSLLLESLHAQSKETRKLFSGSGSTLKSLIPSFKNHPAQLGYLAESGRFAYCDEFLRCLIRTQNSKGTDLVADNVALLNDLLEHKPREVGSGVSKANVNMTARVISVTNPIRHIKNVTSLRTSLDASFLSRWLVYYQTKDHVKMIRDSEEDKLEELSFDITSNDWVGIIDYLQSFSAEYDMSRVLEIHASVPKLLSEELNDHYNSRHKHHIECMIDGIVKTRCLLSNDTSFKATEQDYQTLELVWRSLIRSWIDITSIKNMELKDRIFYLPENSQWLYWQIVNEKRPVSTLEVKEIALKGLSKYEFNEAFIVLSDNGLIIESDGVIKPHMLAGVTDDDTLQARL